VCRIEFKLLIDPNSRFKDNIEVGGLLLCKTPDEFVKQRNAYVNDQTQAQTSNRQEFDEVNPLCLCSLSGSHRHRLVKVHNFFSGAIMAYPTVSAP